MPLHDPLQMAIESELCHGSFISDRRCHSFVRPLDSLRSLIMGLVVEGEAARAAGLCEALLAGACDKCAEVDDSSGEFGRFMGDVLCDWVRARQAAGSGAHSTALHVVARMDGDEYGYCHGVEDRLAEAFDRAGLAAFEAIVASRAATMEGYERRRAVEILRSVYRQQGDMSAYAAVCETYDELTPSDCEVLAKMSRAAGEAGAALQWVDRGLAVGAERRFPRGDSWQLAPLRREILVELGRGREALDDAWQAYRENPSRLALDELLLYAPRHEQWAWRARALGALGNASLRCRLDVLLAAGELSRLAELVDDAPREDLIAVHYTTTELIANALETDHPMQAGKVYAALAFDILSNARSKLYPRALCRLRSSRDLLQTAGAADEWAGIVRQVRIVHGRKWSFMPKFEDLVSSSPARDSGAELPSDRPF